MASMATLLFPLLLVVALTTADAATFTVTNRCSYTVWAASVPVGGGRQLNPGQSWAINVPAGTAGARIWGRNGCSFDGNGNGHCQTGDCGGKLACTGYGQAPSTLAEYSLNQFNNLDFYDISLVTGFNIPMNFVPAGGCSSNGAHCSADVNAACPSNLRVSGGCFNPCTNADNPCGGGPTSYSMFFKSECPQAYSYPKDDATSTFTCPAGTNYNVVFCP